MVYSKIQQAAKDLDGAGGPTKVSAQIWKHILCSRFHSSESDKLADTIADLAKKMCTEQVPSNYLTEFLAGRLIPLVKVSNQISYYPLSSKHGLLTMVYTGGGKIAQLKRFWDNLFFYRTLRL